MSEEKDSAWGVFKAALMVLAFIVVTAFTTAGAIPWVAFAFNHSMCASAKAFNHPEASRICQPLKYRCY